VNATGPSQPPETALPTAPATPVEGVITYTYRVVNRYPHDRQAYTQGLVFEDGVLYEGTGRYGESSLRKVDLATGNVLKLQELPSQYFGEGVTVLDDSIIQLTWQSRRGFVYEQSSFALLRDFTYATEGWGITHDGENLIMSDGTATLYFLDPETFQVIGNINVTDGDLPVHYLNELEYINGRVYANVWTTDTIAIINPGDGRISGWIDLSGLLPAEDTTHVDVLNGIAYDPVHDRLFVTGKLWPYLFEIALIQDTVE
jgi:glutamine cyclotransferase